MADQMRWDALGCIGGWCSTDNLDRLARTGTLFTTCVTNSPSCVPARIALATGWYPNQSGINQYGLFEVPAQIPVWTQRIQQSGYKTAVFGKTHLHPHDGDLRDREHVLRRHGFEIVNETTGPYLSTRVRSHITDYWIKAGVYDAFLADIQARLHSPKPVARPSSLGLEHYYDVYIGRQARRFLQDYQDSAPWFCWVSFAGPHEPWDAPEPYASMYDPGSMPLPRQGVLQSKHRPAGYLDTLLPTRFADLGPADIAALRANYAGNVTLIDHQIGEILAVVEQRGELDDTVIVFSSDHGEMNGDYGLLYKDNFLDGAVRVPLIVSVPSIVGAASMGTRYTRPVELMDIGPTLAELAGSSIDYAQGGKSLYPVLNDPSITHREWVTSQYRAETMILNDSWKMALNKDAETYLLFDRLSDPDETMNLAGDNSYLAVVQSLSKNARKSAN